MNLESKINFESMTHDKKDKSIFFPLFTNSINPVKRVAIIGSAFRNHERKYLNKILYEKMLLKVIDTIKNKFKLLTNNVILVSGGAAGNSQYFH